MKKTKTDLQIKKDKIRKEILAKRNILSDKDINKKSDLIIKNLASYIENIQNIMIFMDMKTEVKITKLLELYPKKNFFISKITNSKNREMKINKYNKNELILHKFGYYESSSSDFYNENILDIVIVPAEFYNLVREKVMPAAVQKGEQNMFLNNFLIPLNNECREFNQANNVALDVAEVNIDFESERFKALDRIFDWSTERGKEMIQRLYVE